jgi:hypothetical protein
MTQPKDPSSKVDVASTDPIPPEDTLQPPPPDPVPNPEPAAPSLDQPDLGVFHHKPVNPQRL